MNQTMKEINRRYKNAVIRHKRFRRFSFDVRHKHHTRTITKRDMGRLFGLTCNDLDEVRIAKAEHEGKTPLIWVDLAFWSLRRQRATKNGRLIAFYGKLCWLLRHTMPMINR